MSRKPPKVTHDTRIGDDVDLKHDHVRAKNGRRVTSKVVDELVTAARKPGRPGLGKTGTSPAVSFRLPPELRDEAERVAKVEGKSVSALAREALEARLADAPKA